MDTLLKDTINTVLNRIYPDISREGRLLLEGLVEKVEVQKGEQIIVEGEVCKNIMLVGQGMIRQYYYKHGKDLTEHFTYEGGIAICLESTLKQEPTHLLVEALEDCVLFCLSYQQLINMSESSKEINALVRKVLEDSLISSQKKADAWRFETAHERYTRLMQNHPEIIRRAPLVHIASYLLMTPETLSRVRAGIL